MKISEAMQGISSPSFDRQCSRSVANSGVLLASFVEPRGLDGGCRHNLLLI